MKTLTISFNGETKIIKTPINYSELKYNFFLYFSLPSPLNMNRIKFYHLLNDDLKVKIRNESDYQDSVNSEKKVIFVEILESSKEEELSESEKLNREIIQKKEKLKRLLINQQKIEKRAQKIKEIKETKEKIKSYNAKYHSNDKEQSQNKHLLGRKQLSDLIIKEIIKKLGKKDDILYKKSYLALVSMKELNL